MAEVVAQKSREVALMHSMNERKRCVINEQ
jgi:hypothetical protein